MRAAMLNSIRSSVQKSSSSATLRRSYSSESAPNRKVAILGAAGGIGQPLSLLMKLNPLVSSLSLYDIAGTPGVAADVSHINTRSETTMTMVASDPDGDGRFSYQDGDGRFSHQDGDGFVSAAAHLSHQLRHLLFELIQKTRFEVEVEILAYHLEQILFSRECRCSSFSSASSSPFRTHSETPI